MWKRRLRIALVVLVGLSLASVYVTVGLAKFSPDGFWTPAFERWGYPVWFRIAIGVIETVGGVMILIPWVASYGSLALIPVMIGAAVTRAGDEGFLDVASLGIYIVLLAWVAYEWWGWRWPKWGEK